MSTVEFAKYRIRNNKYEVIEPPVTLLPCPFCGGGAQIRHRSAFYGTYGFQIVCTKCRCTGEIQPYNVGVWEPGTRGFRPLGKEEALGRTCQRWNRRTAPEG